VGVLDSSPGPRRQRERAWRHLDDEVFDLLVIGGGINGAAVARDAALRGVSVAVVERGDFACGTSSRSTKLIHGGIRYLEQLEFGLVLESCRERDLLRTRLAPHLVRAQRFVLPIYQDEALAPWELRAGLMLYDLLAGFRNVHNHQMLSAHELRVHEPSLRNEGLRGAALYYDCWTDDARLTLETVCSAQAHGATVLNYAEVVALDKDSTGRLATARVRDRLSDREVMVRARCVLNVTGPWLDRIRVLDDAGAPPRLRLTKGVHAVVERSRIGHRDAIVLRSPRDQRVMFAIPWQDRSLVGTTDTYYDGDPARVEADSDDVDYILEAVNHAFPRANLTPRDVIATYAGLRPLVAPEDEKEESDISRDDQIFESPSGLLSLGGGKLTTHRHVAERIVDRVASMLGRSVAPCRTRTTPLPGAAGVLPGTALGEPAATRDEHLRWRYGALATEVSALAHGDARLGERLAPDVGDLFAEVAYAVEKEMAVSLTDVMSRRLHIHLRSRNVGESIARAVAEVMARRLGWSPSRADDEIRCYLATLERSRPRPAGGADVEALTSALRQG
jgi:glycerol-3-phosphate dehydrogenase